MSSQKQKKKTTASFDEMKQQWTKRARLVMLDYYAADEDIYIYGLHLTKAQSGGSLWDIYHIIKDEDGDAEETLYIDTIDVSKFVSATALTEQIGKYYVEMTGEESEPEPNEEDHTDDPDPTPSFY